MPESGIPVTSGLALHLDAANPASYPGTGTTWFDISGNNRNFTLPASGITWNSLGFFNVTSARATGPASNSFGFQSNNNHYIEAVIKLPSANFQSTLFWFTATATGSNRGIQSHIPWSDGNVYYDVSGCCNPDQRISGLVASQFITKSHAAWRTRTTSTPNREVFRNATSILNSGSNSTATTTWNLTTPVYLFNDPSNSAPWQGEIYAFTVYNRALTDSERSENYAYFQQRFSI